MKYLIYPFFLALAFLFACEQPSSSDQAADEAVRQYSIEQFMDNESVFGSSFSSDGSRLLFTSNRTGIFNAYEVPVEGGEMEPLTRSDSSSVYAVSYFPNDGRVLFQMDDNGNEIWHLFVLQPDGATLELTPEKEARAVFYGWAHDGGSFFMGYNKRDPRLMDVYEVDVATLEPRLLYEIEENFSFGGISDDKRYMALTRSVNTNDNDLYLFDLEEKSLTKVNTAQAAYLPADFGKDNASLFILTNEGSEFQYLSRYDIAAKEMEKVLEKDWDIAYAYFSHNGKYRVVGVNADGRTEIEVVGLESGAPVDFPQFENGSISGVNISRDEKQLAFYLSSSRQPSDLYIYDLETGDHKMLIQTLNPEVSPDDLVSAEVVRYPSFDELEIPAIYYKPKQAGAEQKVPALVWVHGGPGGQSRQAYRPLIQYLVNHGYAVLAVNNRGSSGYGKTFFRMDDQNHGEADLKDCIAGKDWLAQQPYIDSTRIGIIGGSYGGFMVMAALTRAPEAFDVGVDIFGVTNWLRTLKNIPPWWASFKDALYEEMGDPYQDSIRLYEISPLFHADKITKPVMVLQGAQDPRVLKVESDEIVEAVKANNVPVEYVLFEDEGHGFVKKDNQIEAYGKILAFLDTYLKEGDPLKD